MTRQPSRKTLTAIATEERTAEVAAMLLNLRSRRDIHDFLIQKYNLKPRSCDNIIAAGYAYIRENYKTDRESVIVKHLEFYYDIARNWKDIDPKASLKAMEQIERLLKLHQEAPLIQNNTLSLNLENVTDEQLMKAIEEIGKNKSMT